MAEAGRREVRTCGLDLLFQFHAVCVYLADVCLYGLGSYTRMRNRETAYQVLRFLVLQAVIRYLARFSYDMSALLQYLLIGGLVFFVRISWFRNIVFQVAT